MQIIFKHTSSLPYLINLLAGVLNLTLAEKSVGLDSSNFDSEFWVQYQ